MAIRPHRVGGNIALRDAHNIADWIEAALMMQHPEIVDVVVHLEPAGKRVTALKRDEPA